MRRFWIGLAIVASIGFLAVVAIFVYDPMYLPSRAAKAYLLTAGIHEETVNVDGNTIAYLESPRPAKGPERPLLLVHGLGASKADWAAMMVPLAKAGFHVYALDLLGYGGSDAPKDATYSISEEENVTLRFMDRMKLQQPDVAGWSMGGWISMKLALDHPERVRRLVLLDSAGVYFPFSYDDELFTPQNYPQLKLLVQTLEPNHPFISVPRWASNGLLRKSKPKQWIMRKSFASMRNGKELLDFRLPGMKVPTLIVWGSEDKLTPYSSAERIHALISNSSLVAIRGCGHLMPGECSRQATPQVVRYLKAEPVPEPFQKTIDGPSR